MNFECRRRFHLLFTSSDRQAIKKNVFVSRVNIEENKQFNTKVFFVILCNGVKSMLLLQMNGLPCSLMMQNIFSTHRGKFVLKDRFLKVSIVKRLNSLLFFCPKNSSYVNAKWRAALLQVMAMAHEIAIQSVNGNLSSGTMFNKLERKGICHGFECGYWFPLAHKLAISIEKDWIRIQVVFILTMRGRHWRKQ